MKSDMNITISEAIKSKEKHFNAEYNGEIYHFQMADNELNQDAIIFSTALAQILGLYTFDYRKYNYGENFYVRSKFIYFEKLVTGSEIIRSFNIDEIKKEFIEADKNTGSEFFRQFCQMIILDIFTLNCDRTHNNWLIENDKILIYDYNFTFGSAELLHGVSNQGLSCMLSDRLTDMEENLVSGKNKFLSNRFEDKHRLDLNDFAEYIIQKSSKDTAHTKVGDEEIGLIPSYQSLIQYFCAHNIELDLINKIINLSAENIFENIPYDSKILSFGNKKYLSYMFDYIKKLVRANLTEVCT